jgi:hypothetical protein
VVDRLSVRRWWPAALLSTGLVVLVVGTFLPWLRSGRSTRDSYQADGVVGRLRDPSGVLGSVLHVWPFLGLVGGVALALVVLGRPRSGAALALVAATGAAAVAIWALNTHGSAVAEVAEIGPAVTLIGAIIVPMGAWGLVRLSARPDSATRSDP